MRKSAVNQLLTIIVLVLLAGLFVYFFIQLNRQDKKIIAIQQTIAQDSGQISAVINFLNNAQAKK